MRPSPRPVRDSVIVRLMSYAADPHTSTRIAVWRAVHAWHLEEAARG